MRNAILALLLAAGAVAPARADGDGEFPGAENAVWLLNHVAHVQLHPALAALFVVKDIAQVAKGDGAWKIRKNWILKTPGRRIQYILISADIVAKGSTVLSREASFNMPTADRPIGVALLPGEEIGGHTTVFSKGRYRSQAPISKINKIYIPFIGEEETMGGDPAVVAFVFASINAPQEPAGDSAPAGGDYVSGAVSAGELAWNVSKIAKGTVQPVLGAAYAAKNVVEAAQSIRTLPDGTPRSQAFLRDKAGDEALAVEVAYDVLEELLAGRRSAVEGMVRYYHRGYDGRDYDSSALSQVNYPQLSEFLTRQDSAHEGAAKALKELVGDYVYGRKSAKVFISLDRERSTKDAAVLDLAL